mgnify:CR=1 FL=1
MNQNDGKKNRKTVQHPLFGISPENWIKLIDKNDGIDLKYLDRAAFITLGSLATIPARLFFKILYQKKIQQFTMSHPPVIIIGHWRSGTTYLHELLSSDPQFCYVSLLNTMLPDSFPLFESAQEFLSTFLPKTRPMDNIEVDINGPYEEEAGIAVLSPWSFFHALHFPRNAEEQYLKSVHFNGLSTEEKKQWKHMYEHFMKTVVFSNNDKRLLLKDPANTARIPLLLDLFPKAKFIHIYRNPYKVYMSTIKMRNKVLDKLALQQGNSTQIEQEVIQNYKRLMNSYFEQKKLIPKDQLVEISYENLVKHPMNQVERIYSQLNIPDFNNAIPYMTQYLERKKNYKTNKYVIDESIIQRVKKEWSFTIKKWGYSPP